MVEASGQGSRPEPTPPTADATGERRQEPRVKRLTVNTDFMLSLHLAS